MTAPAEPSRGRVGGIAFERWSPTGGARAAAVVCIAGADTGGGAWPAAFIDRLRSSGHPVVTFDHREVGDSVGPWPSYDLHDLVADVVSVIDAAGVGPRPHLVASSMGAMVAQLAALDGHARSLVLIATSPGPGAGCPPPDSGYLEALAELAFAEGLSEAEVVERSARLLAGDRYEFAAPPDDGAPPPTRHAVAVDDTPPWHERLGEIAVPTLVVHGTDDPLFPLDHARCLAASIPTAELIEIDGLGHEVPAALLDELSPRILAHLAAA